jgi:hypothetical protein
MSTTEQPTQPLERIGEPCATCGAPLADDQRYCLECGTRRAGLAARHAVPLAAAELPPARVRTTSATGAIAAVGCLLLAMGVGVLIGRSRGDSKTPVAAAPQVITVSGGGGAATAADTSFTDDWPSGTSGYTVQLQALTSASGVAAAKADATAKGAKGVGALKSDNYNGLAAGSFIVYSGVYPKQEQAQKALGRLKAKFPGASVIAVKPHGASASASTGAAPAKQPASQAKPPAAVQQLQNLSGQDYVKKSKALPNVISTGGKAPPVDKSKPAGGGSGFSSIG